MNRSALAVALVLIASAACERPASSGSYQSLTSLDQLRSAFNADSGKVRAIFLASPT
jgi:hypothetical protein